MIDPATLVESRRLLDRARLIAEAPAARPADVRAAARPSRPGRSAPHGKQHKHSHPSSAAPPGAFTHQVSTLEAIGYRINAAIVTDSNGVLTAANAWARTELDLIQRGPPGREPETKEQFRFRLCNDYPGKSARFVADKERVSEELVRKIRTEGGRDARGHEI